MSQSRFSDQREAKPRRDPAVSRRRALLAIPALGVLVLILLWTVIFARLSVEKEATYREAMASAAILSAALEQHTVKAIHQVDQITRFVKYEFEKTPNHFDLASTVEKGVVQSETLVQVSLIDEHGKLIANTAELNPKHIDLSDREHFKVHEHENDDQLFISKPVLGRVSGHWTLQMTRRLNHPDGSFAGVVVVSEDPSYFTTDFYNNAAIGREGVIAVISDNGTVLARRTGSAETANGAFSASGSYPTSEHVSGTYVDSIDNVTRIVSYRHIDGYPLGVLVGLSQAEEFADYNHTRNVYLLMAGFISLAMLSFFAVATGLIGKLLGREREMTHLVEYDLLTGLRNRYATLQIAAARRGAAGQPRPPRDSLHRPRQLQDRQRHARPQRRRHRAANDGLAARHRGRRRRRVEPHRRRRVRRRDQGRRRREARGRAGRSRRRSVREALRSARQFVRTACEHRHCALLGGQRKRDRPAEKSRPRDVQREGRGQELLPVLFAATVASRGSFDEVGTAVARGARRRATVSRLSAEDRSDAPLHYRLRGAGALESSAARLDSGQRIHSGCRIDRPDRADRRLRDRDRLPATRAVAATGLRHAVARGEHLGGAVLARRSVRNHLARHRGKRHLRAPPRTRNHRDGDDGISRTGRRRKSSR